jgi:hypothetical protein
MRNTKTIVFGLALILSLGFSCEEKESNNINSEGSEELKGTWQVYEHGYSPGDKYITEPVPADPAQRITFKDNNQLTTSIENLTEYKYYAIVEDPNSKDKILALFKTENGNTIVDITKLEHSYNIEFVDGKLKLYYRFCIEGCHLGLTKITENE